MYFNMHMQKYLSFCVHFQDTALELLFKMFPEQQLHAFVNLMCLQNCLLNIYKHKCLKQIFLSCSQKLIYNYSSKQTLFKQISSDVFPFGLPSLKLRDIPMHSQYKFCLKLPLKNY